VKAVSSDFILANYVRTDDIDMLKRFKDLDIKIGVLGANKYGARY